MANVFLDNEREALSFLVEDLKKQFPGVDIILFGSKVMGVPDLESDIDVLILLPCFVKDETRTIIIHKVFDVNLHFNTNISPVIISQDDWEHGPVSVLPIHETVERDGVVL